jgi:hypothetical protein
MRSRYVLPAMVSCLIAALTAAAEAAAREAKTITVAYYNYAPSRSSLPCQLSHYVSLLKGHSAEHSTSPAQ